MPIAKSLLTEARSIRGAFSGISRAFGAIDKAMEDGDMAKARLLLRRIQIALEAIKQDDKPPARVDKDRSSP